MIVISKIPSAKFVAFALSLILFFLFSLANAQVKSFGMGGNLGANMLFGDSRVVNSRININYGVYGLYRTASRLSYKFQIGYGKFGYYRSEGVLETKDIKIRAYNISGRIRGNDINKYDFTKIKSDI